MKKRNLCLAVTTMVVMVAPFAQAADATWNVDSGGDWTDNAKWLGGAYASGTNFTATFGDFISADRTINLNAPITIGNITALDTNNIYTISGVNILTLDRTSGAPTINVTSSTLTISSKISGTNGLQKTGGGTLNLSGNNDYTGTTAIDNGIVNISHTNALGSTAGIITITATGSTSTGGQLQLSGGITLLKNITITGTTEAGSYAAAITGTPNETDTYGGNITLSNLTGGIRISTRLSGSMLIFSGTISQTGTSQALVLATAPSGGQRITVSNPIANNGGGLIITGGGASILQGVNATDGSGIGDTTINSGARLKLGVSDALNTTANLTMDGIFDLAGFNQTINALIGTAAGSVSNSVSGTNTLTVGNGGGSGTFYGQINDDIGKVQLIKTGAGTQTLTGNNSYSGTTLINEGTLVGVVDSSCSNSAVTVASAGTLEISVIDNTKQWTCADLVLNNNSHLNFNFAATPSTNLAPLNILGNLTCSGTPRIALISAPGGTYPLLTVTGTVSGTTPSLTGGSVTWKGKTLWVIPSGMILYIR